MHEDASSSTSSSATQLVADVALLKYVRVLTFMTICVHGGVQNEEDAPETTVLIFVYSTAAAVPCPAFQLLFFYAITN